MATTIRSSNQLYIDANLDHHSKKVSNIADATEVTDGVSLGQMNTAIGNATSGLGNSIHVPVADLAACKAIVSADRADKMIMNVESLGLYRFDAESTAASNDDTVIRPTDVASDASPGRWIKMSSTITDHNNLSGKQGGTSGEYYHITSAELTKLGGIETGANVTDAGNVGSSIHGATAKTTPVDADTIPLIDSAASNVLKKVTWANIKATLKTYFDTLYNKYVHPNHTGDVTSVADGATTIATGAVTLAKMANMATASFIGRNTAGTGVPEILSASTVKTLLGLTSLNLAQRKYRVTPTGTVNGSNVVFTIADNVISGTEEVFKNGQLLAPTTDYTISYAATTTITFVIAPSNADGFTDSVVVNYSI
jgi:hypothetical protein